MPAADVPLGLLADCVVLPVDEGVAEPEVDIEPEDDVPAGELAVDI